jgi:polyvinyl alcohol dehydrogenase (cytochrome)
MMYNTLEHWRRHGANQGACGLVENLTRSSRSTAGPGVGCVRRAPLARVLLAVVLALCLSSAGGVRAEDPDSAPAGAGLCPTAGAPFSMSAPHWNGWGGDPSQHRFQPGEMAELDAGDLPRLKMKWAFGFPFSARSVAQPTVVGGRVFIGSQSGEVYSLDAKSGCVYWQINVGAAVRAAVVVGSRASGSTAYFGDQHAIVHAVDALTGKELWQSRADAHPAAVITGSPTLAGGALFVPVSSFEEATGAKPGYSCCDFRGSVSAFEPATGKLLWKSFTIPTEAAPTTKNKEGVQLRGPSGAAVWSSPTFDAATGMVYVTTGDNYSDPPTETSDAILAFDAHSGALAWSRQVTSNDAYTMACASPTSANCPSERGPDFDFGSSAILVDLPGGKRALIAGQKSGVVTALDPDTGGTVIWQRRIGEGSRLGGVQWGMASDGNEIYAAVSDLKVRPVAPGTPGAQPLPFDRAVALLADGRAGGGLHALRVGSGEEAWLTPHPGCNDVPGCSPAQSAAVTAIPGVVFSGGLDGHLRAYAAEDGRILWDADTTGEYRTVNGLVAHGGSIDGGGAVVVGGMLYVSSGSAFVGTMPGNVLLAYSIDGQ